MAVGEDVKAHLDSKAYGVPIYIGPTRPANPPAMPHKAIFVLETGGLAPEPYMDGSTTAYRKVRVQIRIRGEPNDYVTARNLALSVWSSMQQTTSITGNYVRVTNSQSYPLYMGLDQFQCPEFSVNTMLEKEF